MFCSLVSGVVSIVLSIYYALRYLLSKWIVLRWEKEQFWWLITVFVIKSYLIVCIELRVRFLVLVVCLRDSVF